MLTQSKLNSGEFNEEDVRQTVLRWLSHQGETSRTEVQGGGGRADILTSTYIIECKKIASRSNIFQALGQAVTYQQSYPQHKLMLIGVAPKSPKGYKAASNAAQRARSAGIEVIFINQDSRFKTVIARADKFQFGPKGQQSGIWGHVIKPLGLLLFMLGALLLLRTLFVVKLDLEPTPGPGVEDID
ncbi:MAG: hypothetical protein F6K19_39755 [Cyanothece sp. SIO1E1]|nr:hypothetical protein [Cyanothece sp. SIO1E1]